MYLFYIESDTRLPNRGVFRLLKLVTLMPDGRTQITREFRPCVSRLASNFRYEGFITINLTGL